MAIWPAARRPVSASAPAAREGARRREVRRNLLAGPIQGCSTLGKPATLVYTSCLCGLEVGFFKKDFQDQVLFYGFSRSSYLIFWGEKC